MAKKRRERPFHTRFAIKGKCGHFCMENSETPQWTVKIYGGSECYHCMVISLGETPEGLGEYECKTCQDRRDNAGKVQS